MFEKKLNQYKRKYYLNLLVRGSIFALLFWAVYFLIINFSVFLGLNSTFARSIIFYSSLILFLSTFGYWIGFPLFKLFVKKLQLSDSQAARQIGSFFPTINDRLLNTLQLFESYNRDRQNILLKASLDQREQTFREIDFSSSITFDNNIRFIPFLLFPLLIIGAIWWSKPDVFEESTSQIINYSREYVKKAPFQFKVLFLSDSSFKGEDVALSVSLDGQQTPYDVFIEYGNSGSKVKMQKGEGEKHIFNYTFRKVQKSFDFNLSAAGFESVIYHVEVISKPSLSGLSAYLDYPAYTKKLDERIDNNGNLLIPEGTKVSWSLETQNTSSAFLQMNSKEKESIPFDKKGLSGSFSLSKVIKDNSDYSLIVVNEEYKTADSIPYFINVIPDKYPSVNLRIFSDTISYSTLMVGGNISDDYGISAANLFYRVEGKSNTDPKFKKAPIRTNPNSINQDFAETFSMDSLGLRNGDKLTFYAEVWDNDQVNGRKRTKSKFAEFEFPSLEKLKDKAEESSKKANEKLSDATKDSEQLSEEIKDIQDQLKGKKTLEWQDKKNLEKLNDKREKLEKDVKELQELFDVFRQQNQNLKLEDNQRIAEKAEQLQKLLDNILDEETRKLYEELNKLLEKNFINEELQDALENLSMKQKNLENELDRSLKLFKKLKFDLEAEQLAKELEELAKKQEELANSQENTDPNNEAQEKDAKNQDALTEDSEKQEKLTTESDSLKNEINDLKELGEEISKGDQDDFKELEKNLDDATQEQQNAKEQLKSGDQKGAKKSQKKAAQKMKQAAKGLQDMMQSGEMTMIEEDYGDLRAILENLIKLSFDQEDIMKEFKMIKRVDPKFVDLSQKQLKLQGDAKMIEDSLISLSKRVFVIESFVTREVTQMNKYMDESIEAIRKRIPEIAASKQQFTMTSINNLALMLDDILKQMQENLSQAKGGTQMSKKKGGSPSMSQLQQQLNQQIQQLKNGNQSGKSLSKELAKLAAEQEMIRNAMQNALKEMGGNQGNSPNGEKDGGAGEEGKKLKELVEMMKKTEEDLVNKRLSQQTIQRQNQILSRLLESEKAEREKELDKERESKAALEKRNNLFKNQSFEEYFKSKESQIELLRTIAPNLNLYYKNQINKYFNEK